MLKVFRDNLKHLKWILIVVIGILVLFLFSDPFGGFGGSQPGAPGTTAATVGGQTVSVEEFRRTYQRFENQYRQAYGEQFTPEVARQMRLPIQVLDQLVNQKILLAEAERLGLTVSDEEIREMVLTTPNFQNENGQFMGAEAYEQLLRDNGYRNAAEFEADLREDLLLQKLNQALLAGLFVSDKEVEEAYRSQVERAKIRYVQLPASQFQQEAAAQVPRGELEAYFQSHKEEFRLPEQREAAYLLVDTAQLREQLKIGDEELRAYYDQNPGEFNQEEQVRARHILVAINEQRNEQQARQRAEEARRRLAGGADFAAVAREFSDDEASKAAGGDLGYFGRRAMVEEFSNAAFGAPAGQLVGPVKTQYGFHLIETTDKRPGGQLPFEQAKLQIQARLSGEKVQQAAENRAKELASRLAKDKPGSATELQAVAQETPGVRYATTGRFSQNDPIKDLGYAPGFATAAFQLEKGGVSEPIQVPSGWVVIYLQEIHQPRDPQLADVEQRVRAAVARDRMQKLAMQRLTTASAGGKSLDEVAAAVGVAVKESTEFGANGAIPGLGFNPELAKKALSLQQGQMAGPIADPQGPVLFQVTERKAWNAAEFAKNRDQTRDTVKQEKLFRVRAALLEQRRRELGVDYDRQLLESLGITADQAPAG